MQLFYNPNITETATSFVFDKEESKHIIKVLRKKDTDILHVTNGLGLLFTILFLRFLLNILKRKETIEVNFNFCNLLLRQRLFIHWYSLVC